MYKLIWKYVSKLDMKQRHKQNLFLAICAFIFAIVGAVVWFTVGMTFWETA